MNHTALRTAKPWARGDLVIYGIVLLLTLSVCLAVFVPRHTAIVRVQIYYENALVYDYDCATGRDTIYPATGVTINRTEDLVQIVSPKGSNTIRMGKTISMVQADCPNGQCMRAYSPLRYGGQVLVCMPHALRIVTLGDVSNEVIV